MEEEEKYLDIVKKYECFQCMSPCDSKVKEYRKLIKRFKEIEQYKDVNEYIEKCKKIIRSTIAEKKQISYDYALSHFDTAKTYMDYQYIIKELESLEDYKDSKVVIEECKKKQKIVNKKLNRSRILFAGAIVIILAVIILYQTSIGKYYTANAFMKVNLYKPAGHVYHSLGNYKDSNVRYKECQYQLGLKYRERKDYVEALKAFRNAKSRNDSDVYLLEMQKEVINEKKIGQKITIGDSFYIVLRKEPDRVLLVKEKEIKNIPYSMEATNVTWNSSDVKTWLNGEYMIKHFKPLEIENMVDSQDNTIFLLSKADVLDNKQVKLKYNNNQWLKDTVNNSDHVMFLDSNGNIMENGYPASSENFSVRPAFWYSLK